MKQCTATFNVQVLAPLVNIFTISTELLCQSSNLNQSYLHTQHVVIVIDVTLLQPPSGIVINKYVVVFATPDFKLISNSEII